MAGLEGSMFERTIHFAAKWVRASMVDGVHAIGAVSAYICGKSSFLGRAIDSPHASHEIAFAGISMPEGVDLEREEAWVLLDAFERKPDGSYRRNGGHLPRLGSHIDATLPYGMDDVQARRIIEGFARWLTQTHGVLVEYGCHNAAASRDHAHFLVSTRSMAAESYGTKVRALNGIAMQHKDRETGAAITQQREDGSVKAISSAMDEMRAEWARRVGAEIGMIPDHRSFARQGLEIQPVPYVDRRSIEFEKRQANRTGREPSWRADRAQRIADRAEQLVKNSIHSRTGSPHAASGPASKHDRRSVSHRASTLAQMAMVRCLALRQQISVADGSRRIQDAMSRFSFAIDERVRKTGARSSSAWHTISSDALSAYQSASYQKSLQADRGSDNGAGALAEQQKIESAALSRRHLLSLALIEKLVSRNAILALRRTSDIAARRIAEVKALIAKHAKEWATLLESAIRASREIQRASPAMARAVQRRDSQVLVTAARLVAERHLATLKLQIARSGGVQRVVMLQQAADADRRRIIDGRADIDVRTLAALRHIDPRLQSSDRIVVDAAQRVGSRWQDSAMSAMDNHERDRVALLGRYEKRESRLRRVHRLKLAQIRRLVQKNAVSALLAIRAMADQSTEQAVALLTSQGHEWIELIRKQAAEWPARPTIKAKPPVLQPVITRSGYGRLPAAATPSTSASTLAPTSSPPVHHKTIDAMARRPAPPLSHRKIVDEIADRLRLNGKRSDALNQILADYLMEDVNGFDRRTNTRYDLFLEAAQGLGVGVTNPLRPRTLPEIVADPVVGNSPELKAIVEAIVQRVARKRPTPAPNVAGVAITGKGSPTRT